MPAEGREHRVWDLADAHLQGGAVPNEVRDVRADALCLFTGGGWFVRR